MGNCRYFTEDMVDPIAVTAGLVQTALYLDFFYVYFTKCVSRAYRCNCYSQALSASCASYTRVSEFCKDRSSSCRRNYELSWT